MTKTTKRFWEKVAVKGEQECWEWQGCKHRRGYGRFKFEGKMVPAHRMAWVLTVGEVLHGLWVLHHCDNRLCVNPSHLFLGTHADNMLDMKSKGRASGWRNAGEANGRAVLSWPEVEAIREASSCGEGKRRIADRFGVSKTQVINIVYGRQWKVVR